MTIYFKNKKLSAACNSEPEAQRRFGRQNAKKILQRLSEIRASDNLAVLRTLPSAGLHLLKGERQGQFAVVVKQPFRIIFVPQHDPVPQKNDGSIDLEKITEICILEVVDYHGK